MMGAFGYFEINAVGSSLAMSTPDRHGASAPSSNVNRTPDKLTPVKSRVAPLVFFNSMNSNVLPSVGLYINSVTLSAAEGDMTIDAVDGALHVLPLFARTIIVDVRSIGTGVPEESIMEASKSKLRSLSEREPR